MDEVFAAPDATGTYHLENFRVRRIADGEVVYQCSPDTFRAEWIGDKLLELVGVPPGAEIDYEVRAVLPPTFVEIGRGAFEGGPRDETARDLEATASPSHVVVWLATSHGEACFDVLEIERGKVHRRYRAAAEAHHPMRPVLTPDGRTLAFATDGAGLFDIGVVVVDLKTEHVTFHACALPNDDFELALTDKSFVVTWESASTPPEMKRLEIAR